MKWRRDSNWAIGAHTKPFILSPLRSRSRSIAGKAFKPFEALSIEASKALDPFDPASKTDEASQGLPN